MKKIEWNEALNYLDSDLVENHIEQKERHRQKKQKTKRIWFRIGAIAACFCLIIVVTIMVVPNMLNNPNDNNHIESKNEGIKNPNVPSNGDDYDEDKQYWVMIVTEVDDVNIVIAEIGEGGKALVTRKYKVPNWFEGTSTEIKVGDKITVVHNGEVTETDPIEFAEIYEMQYKDSDGCIASVIPQE